ETASAFILSKTSQRTGGCYHKDRCRAGLVDNSNGKRYAFTNTLFAMFKICAIAVCSATLLTFSRPALCQNAAQPTGDDQSFTLKVPVNEVNVMFHAADSKGVPLEHLKRDDMQLLDNGKRQNRLVAFHEYRDLPIRVGFLLDNSP